MLLKNFINDRSAFAIANGHFRRADSYQAAFNSVVRYCNNPSITLKKVFTADFLIGYESYLVQLGRRPNTVSSYLSTLSRLNAQAVEAGLIAEQPTLFSKVFTGVAPTPKRAIAPEVLARVITADLSLKPRLEPCRNYFVLSLLLQGMPFVDLAHLRKTDFRGDRITYHRQKTGTPVEVSVLPETRALIERCADRNEDSPYLFPLLSSGEDGGIKRYRNYQTVLHLQNRHLEELSDFLQLGIKLTTYSARHSWATIAHHNGVQTAIVSHGMGHQAEDTTRSYLAAFKHDHLTGANLIVLSAILLPILEGRVSCNESGFMGCINSRTRKVMQALKKQRRYANNETWMFENTERSRKQSWGGSGGMPGKR